ncbi:Putative ligase [Baekduia alba]|uniref:AMP-binding protein n=1 Tax=Baekduia alba TaxID=2997333 RepID=UPI0023413803|nr:AMP-binding protein [Baekduia alba]WCB96521.1 Putative ligase [Baekduia alba]
MHTSDRLSGAGRIPGLLSIIDADRGATPILTTWDDGAYHAWTWDDWRSRSERAAGALHASGVRSGDAVAVLLTNGFDSCAAVVGAWLLGAHVVSLPMPPRGMDFERYQQLLGRVLDHARPAATVADQAYASVLSGAQAEATPTLALQALRDAPPMVGPGLADDDIAFVQFSSGSTREPRGCVLTARAVAWQLDALAHALRIDPERDRGAVWLPMSHDMGLFGCVLLSYWTGHPLMLGDPQRFLRNPMTWLEDCRSHGATVSAAPSFALDLVARAIGRRPALQAGMPATMRKLVLGGEPISTHTLRTATDPATGLGLPPEALLPAYGLAEATLAVTLTPVDDGVPGSLRVDAAALSRGRAGPCSAGSEQAGTDAVEVVACGRALPGVDVQIESPKGGGDGAVGEICVRSPALAAGYMGDDGWASRCQGGVLRTGDQGFLHDGRLYVLGRKDDMVSVGGRNLFTRDIELALSDAGAIKPGRVAVVNVGRVGTPELAAVVEDADSRRDLRELARELARTSFRDCGARLSSCVFVEAGMLPKTSSGKVQRHGCVALVRAGGAGVVARVALTSEGA